MKPPNMTEDEYISQLEKFMQAVASAVKCLPSYASPDPQDGNAHIMRKIQELTKSNAGREVRGASPRNLHGLVGDSE